MSTGIQKLQEEYSKIRKSGELASIGGTVAPLNHNYLHWFGCFIGPKRTPYEDGLFYFEIKFTNDYPKSKPEVQMRTPIYHPNIDNRNGHVCVNYLYNWKNEYDVTGIVNALFYLLYMPNPDSGYYKINNEKAHDFKNKYATKDQNIDWNTSWDKGWNLN